MTRLGGARIARTISRLLAASLALAALWTLYALPQLSSVLLLIFAGLIFGVMLDGVTRRVHRRLPGRRWIAYMTTLAGLVALLGGVGALIGPRVAHEMPELASRLPQAWDALLDRLNDYGVMRSALDKAEQPVRWLGTGEHVFNVISASVGAVFNLFVVMFVGVYAAAAPQRYLSIGRDLLSSENRRRLARIARELGHELRLWLLGRGVSMALVGVATGLGLLALGVPLAFTLGLWAGLVSFVPYIGPLLGLVPALLIAAVQSLPLAAWVLLVYAGVQTLESMILTPLIQQRAIALPPVVLICAQLVAGVLFGPLGVLLAAPLVLTGAVTTRITRKGATVLDGEPADEGAEQ